MQALPLLRDPLAIVVLCGLLHPFGLVNVGRAEELFREDFDSDGAAGPNPRYTVSGSFHSEPPHNPDEIGNASDQLGPVYWAHSTGVSFIGIPAPTKGRRALLAWDGALAAGQPDGGASPEVLQLIVNTVKWLAADKPAATVVFSPNQTAAPALADRLISAGYEVIDDDRVSADTAYPADVVIKGPDAETASRFANAPQGVLAFGALEHDDMLTSSVGTTLTFQPGAASIELPGHPVAAGLPSEFNVADVSATWNMMGDTLPGGALTIARTLRVVAPTVNGLADVDAMAAGTKPSIQFSDSASEFDFSEGSAGDWPVDVPIPGGASGVWGLVVSGRLVVTTAGRYSLAVGVDDGARLRVDTNRNGLGTEDTIIAVDAAGAHRALYGDATFPATGTYDFEVTAFNSGGAGSVEMSVSLQAGGADTTPISSGSWERLGATSGLLALEGELQVDAYAPGGDPEEISFPLLVLLNGPNDTPRGSVFGGGPFGGYDGAGYFAGSGLNKWTSETIESLGGFRSLRLPVVNVAGKTDVSLSLALAASFLDFETSDFLDLVVYPNGTGGPEVRLARFSAPTAAAKYFVDVQNGGINRLGLEFLDVTYPVPEGATELVVEIRSFTSWWNEIVAFDTLRINAGASPSAPMLSMVRDAGGLWLTFTGTLQSAAKLGEWIPVPGSPVSPYRVPSSAFVTEPIQYFRAVGGP